MAEMTNIFYDKEGDVLYLSVGEPREAISEEMDNDVLLRVDPATGDVVGLTILNLASRFSELARPQPLPVSLNLQPA